MRITAYYMADLLKRDWAHVERITNVSQRITCLTCGNAQERNTGRITPADGR